MTSNPSRDIWQRAPVNEVVAAIQFSPVPDLKGTHLHRFANTLADQYPRIEEVLAINQVSEPFDSAHQPVMLPFEISPIPVQQRLQLTTIDGQWMIQVQNGWFVANWIKKDQHQYPGFEELLRRYALSLEAFKEFMASSGITDVRPNMWEVTYIDQMDRGTVWHDHEDLAKVFPGLFNVPSFKTSVLEAVNSTWIWRLPEGPARLRMTIQTARLVADLNTEVWNVRSVARGPITDWNQPQVQERLNFGRSSVVNAFRKLTSEDAKAYWRGVT